MSFNSNENMKSIKEVPINQIEIGMTIELEKVITEKDIQQFSDISLDYNPIHLDDEYAASSRFKKRIAHGFLTASLFSGIFGTKLPGKGAIYVSQTLNFKRPVYINDKVKVIIKVTKIDYKKNRVFFQTVCKVSNKVVTDGNAEIFIPK